MHYEFGGSIHVEDAPKDVDVFRTAIDKLVKDGDWGDREEIDALASELSIRDNWMEGYDLTGDYDSLTDMHGFFYWVSKKVMELYPECSMDMRFNGFNSSSGAETGGIVELRNRHVRELDYEFAEDCICCSDPECEGPVVSLGDVEFGRDYECEDCGRIMTAKEIDEALADYVEEYDI